MKAKLNPAVLAVAIIVLCILSPQACAEGIAFAGDAAATQAAAMEQVQKYERAIHVMAMLLVGFGFLMVFVKRYGRSALTATYLLTAAALPLYFVLNSARAFGPPEGLLIHTLLLAEFAAASLLICAGAVLGRLKMWQYLILALLFVPCYMANEGIVTKGLLGLLPAGSFLDTGGSIIIHAFGAFFGLGAMLSLTTRAEYETPIEGDATGDRFSLLGSMVLWVFWPSFCSAMVTPADVPHTAVNVILALCGSTLATYAATVMLRRRISPADIANATLAGGVAIGSVCARDGFLGGSFIVGLLAGVLSTVGFAVVQGRLQGRLRKTDTCGVLYLHGLPGLLGGLAAAIYAGDHARQLTGMGITLAIALGGGFIAGRLLAALGRRRAPYEDKEELIVEEAPPVVAASGAQRELAEV